MLLREITVDGYKNLIECGVALDAFNVLVGPNNSGKSNFFEVFSFVHEMLTGSESTRASIFERAQTPQGQLSLSLVKGNINKPITIGFLLEDPQWQVRYSLTVQCTSYALKDRDNKYIGYISEELSIKEPTRTGPATVLIKREKDQFRIRTESGGFSSKAISPILSAISAADTLYPEHKGVCAELAVAKEAVMKILATSIVALQPASLRAMIDQSGALPAQGHIHSFDVIDAIVSLSAHKKEFEEFSLAMCRVLDIAEIKLEKVDIPHEFRKDMMHIPKELTYLGLRLPKQQYSHIKNFSDGTLMIAALLVALYSPHRLGSLICIEEPENGLHPRVLKALLEVLRDHSPKTQIIISTHSTYLLEKVHPEEIIIATSSSDKGTTFDRVSNQKELSRKLKCGAITFGEILEQKNPMRL